MRTDRHDEANSRPPQFCERALKKYHIRAAAPSATRSLTVHTG